MSIVILTCSHSPKKFRLEYACRSTGNYCLELCENCKSKEPTKFLVKEEPIQ